MALKLPALLFLTVAFNGMLNGMLASLLGAGMGFRQTVFVILLSFALFSILVGALSPVAFFVALNLPRFQAAAAGTAHSTTLALHVGLIAYAGVLAHFHLLRLLFRAAPTTKQALQTWAAWIAGNLFVGAQIAYVLRPFFGEPQLPVALLREDALASNFYLGLWGTLSQASKLDTAELAGALGPAAGLALAYLIHVLTRERAAYEALSSNHPSDERST